MSRFKRIKNTSTKKSSVSINEKIAALNKELEKTGMLSEIVMTTDKVYSTSTYVPPQEREVGDVPNSSNIGGDGFTQSSAGSGTAGDAPTYSSLDDLYNSTVNYSIFQTPSANGVPVSYGVVKYGGTGAATNYGVIEEGNIVRLVLGGYIAGGTRPPSYYVNIYNSYLQTNQQFPGYFSDEVIEQKRIDAELATQVAAIRDSGLAAGYEFNVPWQGYRSPQFMESLDGRTTFAHPSKGTLVLSGFQLLGYPNKYTIQEPRRETTTDPIRRGLEDDPIYPGPIPPGMFPPMSEAAYNELRRRAEEEEERLEKERLEKERLEKERLENEEEEEEEERKKREELVKKLKLGFASTVGVSLKTIQRLWSNGSALGNLWKMTDSFLKGDTDFDSLNRLSNSITKTVGRAIGKQAGVPTPTNFLFRYDKWLASGGRGKVDMTKYIDSKSAKILSDAANKLDGKFMKTETIKQQFKRLTSEGKSRKEALDEIATAVQRSVDNQTNADSGNANLKMSIGNGIQIDRKLFVESGGKIIKFSKGYKFAENVGSVKGVGDTMLGRFYGAFGIEMDTFGSGKYAVPAVIGAKYGLQSVHRKYGGSPDRAPQMPYSFTVKSGITGDISESYWKTYEWIDLTKVENDEPISLQEDVGLGLYEPVAMNVDLADIRKGVMPEYPKKPPAKMIDGYHQDSKLRPKEFKDKYLLKIDEKDLLRNHRLKKSEADEMINTVKMINKYLKKNPADLIYVQQRYPVDDIRLAELNWKMDQMLRAGEEYMDSNFKVNQTSFKLAQDRVKKNTALTNPDYIQKHYDELRGTIKPEPRINRKSPSRFFKKPKKKSSMEAINDKIKQLDKDLLI